MLNHLLSSSTGFHGGSEAKESACNAGKPGWSLGREDPLKTEMVTHSGILAWRTPWRQEPCQPQSMGLQRVGCYWETKCSCKEFQVSEVYFRDQGEAKLDLVFKFNYLYLIQLCLSCSQYTSIGCTQRSFIIHNYIQEENPPQFL